MTVAELIDTLGDFNQGYEVNIEVSSGKVSIEKAEPTMGEIWITPSEVLEEKFCN